jgi:hypothetical protein
MIKCSHCKKPATQNSTITERGVVTQYAIASNPAQGDLLLRSASTFCGDDHEMELTCAYCGQETTLHTLARNGKYTILAPTPKTSDTHSTCDNCGKKWKNAKLHFPEDFWGRVQPGDTMPSGQCPKCGCLCFPSAD